MDFTEIYKHSSLVAFSPGAHFILTAVQDRVIVRRTDTFQITRTWLLDASPSPSHASLTTSRSKSNASSTSAGDVGISHVGWSCDSEYILATCAKRGVVHLIKLPDAEWNGRINAGAEGLVKAEWAPDGRTILCFSEWGVRSQFLPLRVTIWSLLTGAATYIQFPVHPDRGYTFRSDGHYFLLAERHKSKDTLGIYDTSDSYKLVRHFPLPTTSLFSLSLSPTGNSLVVWEGPLEYKLYVLSLSGTILATFSPDTDPGFGIRNVTWHPSGLFLVVGGWDDKIHVLDCLSWSPIATLELSARLPGAILWREPLKWFETTEGRGFLSYERTEGPQSLSLLRVDQTKPNPRSGAAQLEFNTTGSLLLVRFDTVPTAVHIYKFPSPNERFMPKLRTVLLHSQNVAHVRWNPVRKGKLALCCGGQSVYTWSDEWSSEGGIDEEIAECIGVPARRFETRDLRWAPDGKGFILLDKDQFCCAFEVQDDS